MKKTMMKRIMAFALAAAMVFTSLAVPSVQAEAASAKSVKTVKLKIGSKTVTNKKYAVAKGETKKLKVVVTPGSAKKSIKFKSNKKSVATVDKNGKITAKAVGTAKISVTVTGKNKKKTTKYVNIVVQKPSVPAKVSKGYKLKWYDEFDGKTLNRNDWNVELHDPGWVNAELQKYVDSKKNIYLKNGKLVIKPIQTKNADGTYSYTSGRINTQNKHDFKYGIFEARVKVPEGKGYLPAFWMMPQDENLYGQWPRCGEIDIMEVLGDATDTAHGTIHYGNPHNQNQGTYNLSKGSFSDSYHTFAVEWLPGEIIWYVDGKEYYRTKDWYSTTEGQGTLTYPAPFDQPFHVILNLAVGGSWVGYPDDATFKSQNYSVDYVRIYQKDSYDDSKVKAPEKVKVDVPEINKNLVRNGSFAAAEALDDEKDWSFMTANGGEAKAEIKENAIHINTTNAGEVDYSVQLVQPNLPMKKGAAYEVSFEAYADSARTMSSKISAPDNGWAVYGGPETIELTTEKKTYSYKFTMTADDDANGRLEFNMGNFGSTAGIHISNVSVKVTSYEEPKETKTVLADGNYIYNGAFQEGDKRLGYWKISKPAGAKVSVTNKAANDRRLKIVAPAGTSKSKPVTVSQSGLALTGGKYAFSFDVEGKKNKKIKVSVAGQEQEVTLNGKKQTISSKLTLSDVKNKTLVFTITSAGTYYLDNIRLVEDSLIKNGNFNAGFAGFEPYVDGSAAATYVVDSQKEKNAANFGITNTGDADWKIQLKQNNVELEKGQWYRLKVDVKSTKDRKFMYAIQRDGSKHNDDWTPYVQETVDITGEWQTFTSEFQMKEPTDTGSVLSLSMGAVGGTQITEPHDIFIDNISLEEIKAPAIEAQPAGVNLLKNADFSGSFEDGWTETIANWEGGPGADAVRTINGKSIAYDIKNVGTEDWNVQLKQSGITLEAGATYKVSFKAKSTAARTIKSGVMSKTYNWYGGADIALEADTEKQVEFEFTMKEADTAADFYVSMGQILDDATKEKINTPASIITLSDFSLVKE